MVAGVVVIYNPEPVVTENIRSYIDQLEKLFIIDNSEISAEFLRIYASSNTKIVYVFNNENLGIAAALNKGAKMAIEGGYEYLLTMDQDSRATKNMVYELLEYYNNFKSEPIGIVTAFQNNRGEQTLLKTKTSKLLTTMTSGNLLCLEAYRKTGAFKDEFFIDYVDKEYCLRLKSFGYNVIRLNYSILIHNLGNAIRKNFLWWNFFITNHSPLRIYYRTRNRFNVINQYKFRFPLYCLDDLKNLLVEIFKIVAYEKQVKAKLMMIWRGYTDYRKKVVGKY